MTDLLTATQDAVFAALSIPAVTNLAPVYQHVPEDTQPPMVIVGEVGSENEGSKGETLDRVTIEVICVHRAKGRRGLFALMSAARDALDGQQITSPDATLSTPTWLNSSADEAEDGVTYVGLMNFEIYAEPV